MTDRAREVAEKAIRIYEDGPSTSTDITGDVANAIRAYVTSELAEDPIK